MNISSMMNGSAARAKRAQPYNKSDFGKPLLDKCFGEGSSKYMSLTRHSPYSFLVDL